MLAWGAGGLEAGAAVHAVFNLVAFVQAFLFAQPVAISTSVTAADQFSSLWILAPFAVVTAFIVWWFRRSGVRRTYAGIESGVPLADDRSG